MRPKNRKDYRRRRHLRVRKRISGTANRPRMAIFRSNRYLYVQLIDDDAGVTLASASSTKADGGRNMPTAELVGRQVAESATAKGISQVVVDRGGFRYHGCVRKIVETAVASGLQVGSEAGDKTKVTEAS